jgi:GTP-binding protein
MEVKNVFLDVVAVKPDKFPDDGKSEIAFVGRSNVGKSSLINCMVSRKALARTSQKPGKTRTINFYNVEERVCFVDLPGYGYAKISKSESEKWGKMIEDYLINREQLKTIVLLIDIRHEPIKNDIIMYNWLKHYNHKIVIAATKADKLKRSQVQKQIAMLRKGFLIEKEDIIIPFSSETKDGREVLWEIIQNVAINDLT